MRAADGPTVPMAVGHCHITSTATTLLDEPHGQHRIPREPEGAGVRHTPDSLRACTRFPTTGLASVMDDLSPPRRRARADDDPGRHDSGPSALAALGVRNFRLFWASQIVSVTGTWMQVVAQSWLVLQISHSSPAALGLITFVQFLPVMVLALPAGVIVDRAPKRRLLLATQVAAMVQAIVLAVLVESGRASLWSVGLLAFALGTINAINNPTQQAFVPEMVPMDLVPDAVALNSAQFNGSRMLGSALGGICVATLGVGATLVINAISFALPIMALAVMRADELRPVVRAARQRGLTELREGLAYVRRTPAVLTVVVLLAVIGTFGFNWQVVAPLLAHLVLHREAAGFGILLSAMAAGALIGAVALTFAGEPSELRIAVAGGGLGCCLIALGFSTSYPVSVVLMVIAGIAGAAFTVSANTRLQLLSPPRLRGRLLSLFVLLMGGTTPIGGLLLGQAAEHLGISAAVALFGALCVGSVVVVTLLWVPTARPGRPHRT